mmetsp:Transcript_67505/g.162019  ORF Transcript_67505/g.162019 Transcript_67505/m.162019 type:complete len:592 (+) Transcript_67505:178-1953(+)
MGAIASYFFVEPDDLGNGQLFWTLVTYGYVLFQASNFISDGSELLLLIPALSGIVGSIVLPVLGAVPDGMMVVFSGLGPLEVAQTNVAVGIGALAGSTIMLLTLPWFLAILGGRVDLDETGTKPLYTKSPKLTKPFCALSKVGIKFNEEIQVNANIMLVTALGFLFIQIPALQVDNQSTEFNLKAVKREAASEKIWSVLGFVYCTFMFLGYLYLQYRAGAQNKDPDETDSLAPVGKIRQFWRDVMKKLNLLLKPQMLYDMNADRMLKKIRLYNDPSPLQLYIKDQHEKYQEEVQVKYMPPNMQSSAAKESVMKRLQFDPQFEAVIAALFNYYSQGGRMAKPQFSNFFTGCGFEPSKVDEAFKEADKNQDYDISKDEFSQCFRHLVADYDPERAKAARQYKSDNDEGSAADDDEEEAEIPEDVADLSPEERAKVLLRRSFMMMGFGTLLVLVFSDPMVDVLAEVGVRTGVPAFYISFILAPLASNASELVSALNYASKKTQASVTISLSTLVGAACMNNTFCLGIFYALIYAQGLAWKFTAETFAIFVVQLVMYALIHFRRVHTMVTAFVILSVYPLSLALVYFMENVAGYD